MLLYQYMRKKIRSRRLWLASLVGRIGIIAMVVLLLLVLFYILGSRQNFTESTQFFLLRAIRILGLVLSILMIYNVVAVLYGAFAGYGFKIGRFFLAVLGLAVGAAAYAFSVFFVTWLLS